MTIRLNKLLATRGVAARRKCNALIESGAVQVNGEVVTAPGARVEPGRDRILIRGQPLPGPSMHRYFMLHKPVGMITTLSDPEGRSTVADVMPPGPRLYPVGRLDADTSGLLILTNDGDLAHHLMHPRYEVEKFYRVWVERAPSDDQIRQLAAGVEFEPGVHSGRARVRVREPGPRGAAIEIAVREGRHHQVRLMCEAVGLTVRGLHRWGYGALRLGELARGMWRELAEHEVARLRAVSARPHPRPPRERSSPGPRRRPSHAPGRDLSPRSFGTAGNVAASRPPVRRGRSAATPEP
ncbi:MAG: hypothetical protein A2V63_12100, partial [Candidatus Eisenbacteria bacterium RBG_19FT_COMBO_70_11]